MLVSVIVPVYKVEKYLSICIESILNQTFKDFELILVDDGSPDNCGKICDFYALKDSRIRTFHKENGGLSDARNFGIDVACGEYVTFIDSDDFVDSKYLEILYSICLKESADISVCSLARCDEDSTKIPELANNVEVVEKFTEDKMNVFISTQKIHTSACAKLFDKKLFNGVRFPKGKYYEDVFTTYLLVHKANKIVKTTFNGYGYRCNPTSIINEKYSPRKMDAIEGTLQRANFIAEHYPSLKRKAYFGVIYSCNKTLSSMGKSRVYDFEKVNYIQDLYRKYIKSYVFSKSTLTGKLFAVLSCLNVRFSWFFARFI